MLLSLAVAALLSQTPEAAPAPAAAPMTPEEKNAQALERLTSATEKLAAAAERLSPPPTVEVAAPPVPKLWDFFINGGLTWSSGNVAPVSFVASAGAIRKGEKTIFQVKAFGGYGQKFNAPVAPATSGTTDVLLYNAGGTAQFDYRFTKMISTFVGAGVDTDHVKSVELRGYGDLGVGVLWLDQREEKYQKLLLKTDLNLRVQPESRFQYYPGPLQVDDAFLLGPRLAANFRYAMNAGTFVGEELEIIPNVIGATAGRVLINSITKLAVGIAANVSLTAILNLKYDSQPAAGRQGLDTLVTVGVEAVF